ncbi:hypothetical protein [Photobacterium toruni]|uniref:hypothetical protein n=1 Tax=Photobacterium toruni TaxID=1935446 RepID=UPI0021106447|nr:hypothetical protein [Photobacterium toruni]
MLCVTTTTDGFLKVSSAVPCDGTAMVAVSDMQSYLDAETAGILIAAAIGLYCSVFVGKFILSVMGFR